MLMQLRDWLSTDLLKLKKDLLVKLKLMTMFIILWLPKNTFRHLPADDPRVIQDEAERAEAQAVIDATPQNVIDAINN